MTTIVQAPAISVLEKSGFDLQTVLEKGLDSGTAFEILSIDIADVDVGRNIGAQLQTDQAEADKRIAQAKAEERRAMAVAREQEMKAAVIEMRSKVVEAEAEIPKAMSQALREGKLGVMDYYNMQNISRYTDAFVEPRRKAGCKTERVLMRCSHSKGVTDSWLPGTTSQ